MEGNHHVGLFEATGLVKAGPRYVAVYYRLGQVEGQGYFTLIREYSTMSAAQAAATRHNKEVNE